MIRSLAVACFLSILLLPTSIATVAAECKAAILDCDGHMPDDHLSTTDPAATRNCDALHTTSRLAFDHVAGLASVDAVSVSGHWPFASLLDDYVLTGPPAGTVVPLTVVGDFELQNVRKVTAVTWVGGGIFTPPIEGAPNPNTAEVFFTASAPGTETTTQQARMTMDFKVGVAYEIQFTANVFASGGAGGYAHGRLSFEGLPEGASITGCKGFRQDQPTPALPLSWGALKATYR